MDKIIKEERVIRKKGEVLGWGFGYFNIKNWGYKMELVKEIEKECLGRKKKNLKRMDF